MIELLRTPHKLNRLVLAPTGRAGDFDSHGCDAPFLFRHGGRWHMTYHGFDGVGYRTGLASSDDLLTWTDRRLLLDRGPAGSPTEFNVSLPSIVRDSALFGGDLVLVDGRYLGTYHAYPLAGYEAGPGAIGLCRSDDVLNWDLGDIVLSVDGAAAWERGGLYKPYLLERDGRLWMFYNAKDRPNEPWREQIGVAWSDDLGASWTRHEANPIVANGPAGSPDEIFAADPCVLHDGRRWVMFYYGLAADGHARELAALSDDLLTWTKCDEVLVDVGPPGSVDAQYAHKPGIISADGVLYHFYCGVRSAEPGEMDALDWPEMRGITLATSWPVAG